MTDKVDRGLGNPEEEGQAEAKEGRRIVSVIGIDRYQYWPALYNAVKDATGIQQLLVEKFGFIAPFAPLLNEQASYQAILELVNEKLREELKEDDSLLLFFAGHGHTREDMVGQKQVQTGYLIPVGARYEVVEKYHHWGDLLELDPLLRAVGKLPARHVLVILDSCHSGIALDEIKIPYRGEDTYERIHRNRIGRRIITSAGRGELALDAGPIPGHSLFTGMLIQGLNSGEADLTEDDLFSASDLGLYLETRVSKYPQSRQKPEHGAFHYDDQGQLIIPRRSQAFDAQQSYELGWRLFQVGLLLDEPGPVDSAIRQFRRASDLSRLVGERHPQAELGWAQALSHSGQAEPALQLLEGIKHFPETAARACLEQGIILARQGKAASAIQALQEYLVISPQDENAAWVQAFIARLQVSNRRQFALLIGIAQVKDKIYSSFSPEAYIPSLRRVLEERYGFKPENIALLTRKAATCHAIRDALEYLAQTTAAQDRVLIYYAGVPLEGDALLVAYDSQEKSTSNTISAIQLHDLLKAIPAEEKTFVFERNPNQQTQQLIDLARQDGDYALILAASAGQMVYQMTVPDKQQRVGMFSRCLIEELAERAPTPGAYPRFVQAIADRLEHRGVGGRQTPQYIGDPGAIFFGDPGDRFLALHRLAEQRNFSSLNEWEIHSRSLHLRKSAIPYPQAQYVLGRAFMEKEDVKAAADLLKTSLEGSAQARLALAVCLLYLQDPGEALQCLQGLSKPTEDLPQSAWVPLARLFYELGELERAEDLLRQAIQAGAGAPDPLATTVQARYLLGVLLCARGQYELARQEFQSFLEACPEIERFAKDRSRAEWLTGVRNSVKYAILIGINQYPSVPLTGPVNDARLLKTTLVERCGFDVSNIRMLLDNQATLTEIYAAFSRLSAEVYPDDVLVFFFSGHSIKNESWDGFLVYDEGWIGAPISPPAQALTQDSVFSADDLHLRLELIPSHNITAILDTGATQLLKLAQADRKYDLWLAASPGEIVTDGSSIDFRGVTYASGAFSGRLVKCLWDEQPEELISRLLLKALKKEMRRARGYLPKGIVGEAAGHGQGQTPLFTGDPDRRLFDVAGVTADLQLRARHLLKLEGSARSPEAAGKELLAALDNAPAAEAIPLLEKLVDQHERRNERYPEGRLNLGITYALCGWSDRALDNLYRAVALYSDTTIMQVECQREPDSDKIFAQARYHHGRVLFESGRDYSKAESELKEATQMDKGNARAYYYLGLALAEIAQRETPARAIAALQTYLERGAPLGQEPRVRKTVAELMGGKEEYPDGR